MSWHRGYNFRSTAGFVTDGTDEFPVHKTTTYSAPQGYGFDSTTGLDDRDRNSGVDRRLAGIVFATAFTRIFRVDLPAAGDYDISVAMGDYDGAQSWKLVFKDGATTLFTVVGATSGAFKFLDATQVERNPDEGGSPPNNGWPLHNVAQSVTFAGTILTVELQDPGGGASGLAHFSITSTTPPPLAAGTIAVDYTAGAKTPGKITINTTVASSGGTAPLVDTLQRATDSGFTQNLTDVTSPDTTVVENTRYYYRLRTVDDVPDTVYSNTVEAVARYTGVYPASYDANGFGVWPLRAGAKQVFVDSSDGNDAFDGLSGEQAKATLSAALALITSGDGDQLIVIAANADTFPAINKNGYSEDYPFLIIRDALEARTEFDTVTASAVTTTGVRQWIAVSGFDFVAGGRKPGHVSYDKDNQITSPIGCSAANTTTGYYVEDCLFDHYKDGFTFSGVTLVGFTERNNRVRYSYGGSNGSASPIGNPRPQGLFASTGTYLRSWGTVYDHCGWHDHDDFNQSRVLANVSAVTNATTFRVEVVADYATGYWDDCHVEMLFKTNQPLAGVLRNIDTWTRVDATHGDIVLASALPTAPVTGQTLYLDEMCQADTTGGRPSTVVAGSTDTILILDVQGRDYAASYFVDGRALVLTGAQATQCPLITVDARTSATRHTVTLSAALPGAPSAGDLVHLCNPQKNMGRRRNESHAHYFSGTVQVDIRNCIYLESSAQDRKGDTSGAIYSENNFSWGGSNGSYFNGAGSESSYNVVYEPHSRNGVLEVANHTSGASSIHHNLLIGTGVAGAQILGIVAETPTCAVHHNIIIAKHSYVGVTFGPTTTTGVTAVSFTDNIIACTGTGNVYLVHFGPATFDSGKFTFARNTYFAADSTPILKNGFADEISYDTWKGAFGAGEIGSIFAADFAAIGFPAATRTAETYLTMIGVTSNIGGMRTALATNDKDNYDSDLAAAAINDYLRAGFVISSGSNRRRRSNFHIRQRRRMLAGRR